MGLVILIAPIDEAIYPQLNRDNYTAEFCSGTQVWPARAAAGCSKVSVYAVKLLTFAKRHSALAIHLPTPPPNQQVW